MPVVRLIDANALEADFNGGDCMKSLSEAIADKRFVVAIRQAPTIDAVPVVRCRECKKRGHDWECPLCWMEWFENEHIEGHFEKHDETEDDGFCHKGAKMDAKEVEADE